MFGFSLTFARIGGAPIRAHVSLLLVFFIFVSPALDFSDPGGISGGRPKLIVWSLLLAAAFLTTILLHELGHVFQARREGMEVQGVTLWALGGVAHLSGGTPSAGRDFRVAAAGPAVTALLAAAFHAVSLLGPAGGGSTGGGRAVAAIDLLGRTQIWLLVFNLIPAYPLDGGRMFLALLWRLRDNLTSASRTAAAVGKGFGGMLMAVGALGLLSPRLLSALPSAFRINSVAGVLVGYFIFSANRSAVELLQAGSSGAAGQTERRGLVVADFMNRDFVIAEPQMTVENLLRALSHLSVRPIALVIDDGRPLGMVSKQAAEKVPLGERESKRLVEVMVARGDIRTVNATDPLAAARRALEDGPETAVVLHNDVVVGLVSVSDVAHAMVLEKS